jgi:hypothetical protein
VNDMPDQGELTSEGASGSPESALSKARSYLERAEAWLGRLPGFPDTPVHVTAAAAIGTGYAVLAGIEAARPELVSLRLTSEMPPELITAVERARRTEAEARRHDDERAPEHAIDCQGCDGPGVVPCLADEVRDDLAYRDGFPIKDLRPEAGRG